MIDDTTKRDIAGVAFIILAIVCMVIVVMPQDGAVLSSFISSGFHLTFGIGCYILPFLFAAIGVTFLYRTQQERISGRAAIGLALVFVAILGFISLFTPISVLGTDDTGLLFSENMLVNYGGYIGAAIGWAGITFMGRVVTGIVLVGLIVVGILVIGFSISKTIDLVRRKGREYGRRFSEHSSDSFMPKRHRNSDDDAAPAAGVRRGSSFDYGLDDLPSRPTNITRPLMAKPRYPEFAESASEARQSIRRSASRANYGDESRLPGPFVSPYRSHDEAQSEEGRSVKTMPIMRASDASSGQSGFSVADGLKTIALVQDAPDDDEDIEDADYSEEDIASASESMESDGRSGSFTPNIPSGFIPIEDIHIESDGSDDDDMIRLPVIGSAALNIPFSGGGRPEKNAGSSPELQVIGAASSTEEAHAQPNDGRMETDGDDVALDEPVSHASGTAIPKKPYVVLDDIIPEVVPTSRKSPLGEVPEIRIEEPLQNDASLSDGGSAVPPATAKPAKRQSDKGRAVAPVKFDDGIYRLPAMSLLKSSGPSDASKANDSELEETAGRLQTTLSDFGIKASVVGWIAGPTVTLFKVDLPAGVRVSRITALNDDLALALAAPGVRIFAPIPGTNHVGIEVPNAKRQNVYLADVITDAPDGPLQIAIGKDVEGNSIVTDLARMPHLLIGGTTGSGKSVSINAMIMSILMRATPDEVRFIMIDPKRVEFTPYNGIPHLYVPVVTEPKEAASALSWGVAEMERRLKVFSKYGARNISQFNAKVENGQIDDESGTDSEKLPYIVIIIDELADLMMNVGKEVEFSISRIAQLARAAGIHLIVATQRPSTNVVTGLIKANITNRIAFNVASGIDSRVILDTPGAENLIGLGDLLFSKPEFAKPQRIQGCFVSEDEINSVVDIVKAQSSPEYHSEILSTNVMSLGDTSPSGGDRGDDDPLLWEAAEIVVSSKIGSTSNIQRRLKVGYSRAGRIMDQLEEKGIVSCANGTKPREVLVDAMELETLKAFELQDQS